MERSLRRPPLRSIRAQPAPGHQPATPARPATSPPKNSPTQPSLLPPPTATSSSAPPTPPHLRQPLRKPYPTEPSSSSRWSRRDSNGIYPGIAPRRQHLQPARSPSDPAKMLVPTSHPAPYTRRVADLCPQTIRPWHSCALHRRSRRPRPRTLHRSRQSHRTTPRSRNDRHLHQQQLWRRFLGGERGREYDTMSWPLCRVGREGDPPSLVEKQANASSSPRTPRAARLWAAALADHAPSFMAWYHPELYHRVLTYLQHLRQPTVAVEPPQLPTAHGSSMVHRHPQQLRPSPCASGWKSATATTST